MLIRYVRMTFEADKVSTFLDFFNKNKVAIRSFPGCSHLALLQDLDNPNVFMTHSHWENADDLEDYRTSPLFEYVWGNTKIHFAAKPVAYSVQCIEIIEPEKKEEDDE